jgi:hypothetical protein
MIRTTISLAAVLSAALLPLSAQNKPPVTVEIRMLAFSPELQLPEAFAQDPTAPEAAASVPAPIKSYLNHQFSTMTLTSRKIVFTTKPERASLKHDEELIGEVTLPDGVNSAILLFLPGKQGGKGRYQIMAINDSKRAFPAGSFYITNLSPLPVRLMLEQKNFDFKPGQTVLIEDPPVREGDMSGMRTFAFKDNAWAPVSTGLWPHPGTSRSLKVLFQNPTSGNIQMMAFDDVPPRAPREQVSTAKVQ